MTLGSRATTFQISSLSSARIQRISCTGNLLKVDLHEIAPNCTRQTPYCSVPEWLPLRLASICSPMAPDRYASTTWRATNHRSMCALAWKHVKSLKTHVVAHVLTHVLPIEHPRTFGCVWNKREAPVFGAQRSISFPLCSADKDS